MPYVGYNCNAQFNSVFRCLSRADLPFHRPDVATGSAGVSEMRRKGESHPEGHMDHQRVPTPEIGEVQ